MGCCLTKRYTGGSCCKKVWNKPNALAPTTTPITQHPCNLEPLAEVILFYLAVARNCSLDCMSKRKRGAKQQSSKDEPFYEWEVDSGDASPGLGLENGEKSDCSTDSDGVEGQGAVEKLKELLVKEHRSGHMAAKTLCHISHWATQAGLSGLESLAMAPSRSSGNFSRHLQAVYQKEGKALAAHF
eukprot:3278845-Amphidinium_carterae.1